MILFILSTVILLWVVGYLAFHSLTEMDNEYERIRVEKDGNEIKKDLEGLNE
jgi:hypothetical protein